MTTIDLFLQDAAVDDVIVVDNGSGPEAVNRILSHVNESNAPDRVTIVEVGYNSGFGPGVNRAWELWLADRSTAWCAVAPHDAQPAEGTLAAMVDAAVDHDLGLVSADVGDGMRHVVDHVFGPIPVPVASELDPEDTKMIPVDYPHGTLMLVSRKCLAAVGLFDERYFAYCEEADLGLRAARAGYPSGLVMGARVHNPHVNTPAPMVDYLMERNTVLLLAKHFGLTKAAMRFTLTLWQLLHGLAVPSRRGSYWSTRARLLAIRDIVRREWGPPPTSLQN